ncbi:uncharacterized protein LOC125774297 [Anopheles funestus]|uniref:uncharacterized protein LOC125774297 n=1 Tax=Anopheles funestus TaxID=62324 RepID=UPI0020C6C120|nr:uncharacterized protein LOC125774297 [Anopheles funestus]
MADQCLSCTRAAAPEDPSYRCDGFCKRWSHRSCLGVSSAVFKELTKGSAQFLWLCSSCAELRCSGRSVVIAELSAALTDLRTQLMEEFESRLTAASERIKGSVLGSLSHLINVRHPPHASSSTITRTALATNTSASTTHTPPVDSTNPAKRRLIDRSPPSDVMSPPPTLLTGTAPITSASHAALLLPPETPKFWLYLSRCRPLATVQEVQAFVKEQLGVDDVIARKLVPANRDLSTLTFSSFKVGLSLELRERALSRSSWPVGTVFKEFSERRTNNLTTLSPSEDRLVKIAGAPHAVADQLEGMAQPNDPSTTTFSSRLTHNINTNTTVSCVNQLHTSPSSDDTSSSSSPTPPQLLQ